MERIHSENYTCWSGRHSVHPNLTSDDLVVNCQNCLKTMSKKKKVFDRVEKQTRAAGSFMSNEVLLDTILSIEIDYNYRDEIWEVDVFEREVYIEILKDRLGDWLNG